MKTAFLASHHVWPAHYETAMELMEEHLEKGDEVIQLLCDSDLTVCDLNIEHSVAKCLECISKRKAGLKLLSSGNVEEQKFLNITPEILIEINKLPKRFTDFEELISYKIENFSAGFAVASSVITILQDPYLDTNKREKIIYDYLYTSCAVYFSLKKKLVNEKIDRLYIYNGRFAHVRAALSAAQEVNVECILHENGCNKDYYELYYNQMPQRKAHIQRLIIENWDNSSLSELIT